MAGMDGAFRFIANASEDLRERMPRTLLMNLEDLLSWLETFARNTKFLPDQPPDDIRNKATARVNMLLEMTLPHLKDYPSYAEKMVNYGL